MCDHTFHRKKLLRQIRESIKSLISQMILCVMGTVMFSSCFFLFLFSLTAFSITSFQLSLSFAVVLRVYTLDESS